MTTYSFPGMNPDGAPSAARRERLDTGFGLVSLLLLRRRSRLYELTVDGVVGDRLEAVTLPVERSQWA